MLQAHGAHNACSQVIHFAGEVGTVRILSHLLWLRPQCETLKCVQHVWRSGTSPYMFKAVHDQFWCVDHQCVKAVPTFLKFSPTVMVNSVVAKQLDAYSGLIWMGHHRCEASSPTMKVFSVVADELDMEQGEGRQRPSMLHVVTYVHDALVAVDKGRTLVSLSRTGLVDTINLVCESQVNT